jgi:hypothetical protein
MEALMPTSDLQAGPRAYQARFQPYVQLANQIFQTGQALERTTGAVGDFLKAKNKEKYRLAALNELKATNPHVYADIQATNPDISLEDLAKGLYQMGVVNAYYDKAQQSGARLVNKETIQKMAFRNSQEGTMTLVKGLDDARQLAEGKTMKDLYRGTAAEVAGQPGFQEGGKTEQEIASELIKKPIKTREGEEVYMPIDEASAYAKALGKEAPKEYQYKYSGLGSGKKGGAAGSGPKGELTQKDIVSYADKAASRLQSAGTKAQEIAQKAMADIFLKPEDKKKFTESGVDGRVVAEYVKWAVASREMAKTKDPMKAYQAGMDAFNKLATQLGIPAEEPAAVPKPAVDTDWGKLTE